MMLRGTISRFFLLKTIANMRQAGALIMFEFEWRETGKLLAFHNRKMALNSDFNSYLALHTCHISF